MGIGCMVEAAKNVAVKQLTFVEPVKPRTLKHMLPALARMYNRIRALGLPLCRLRSERAREFVHDNWQHGPWSAIWSL